MFSKNRNKIKLNHILLAILPGLIVAGFWGFANSNPKTIFDELRLPGSKMVIDANDNNIRTVIAAEPLETDEPEWVCGDDITFNYRRVDITYGTVEKDYGGGNVKCWMDRNLGATAIATARDDSGGYGDLFQWGRLDDDHQATTSNTTSTLSTTDNPGHNNFILSPDSPNDWRSGQNNNLWQGDGGINNPCPTGWRVPTSQEWDDERLSWGQNNSTGAIASPLKLSAPGRRNYHANSFSQVGLYGYYWGSVVSGTNALYLFFSGVDATMANYSRAYGLSIRCLKG